MREILFRGMTEGGEWVYGKLVYNNVIKSTKEIYFNKKYSHDITEDYKIKHESVGQYTGLEDRNGNKIFEGDRVVFDDGDGWEVGEGVIKWDDFFGIEFEGQMYSPIGSSQCIEITGNIHQ